MMESWCPESNRVLPLAANIPKISFRTYKNLFF